MATYTLTRPEVSIVTSWLFEPAGYLDAAVNTLGVSARQALSATPTLDVTTWIHTNSKGSGTGQSDWDECSMVWWIRSHSGVNIPPPQRPPETALWINILQAWDASIDAAAIQRAVDAGVQHELYAEDGTIITQPTGQNRQQQKTLFSKVLGVLQ